MQIPSHTYTAKSIKAISKETVLVTLENDLLLICQLGPGDCFIFDPEIDLNETSVKEAKVRTPNKVAIMINNEADQKVTFLSTVFYGWASAYTAVTSAEDILEFLV